jgi:hypothetical protein
VSCDVGSLRRSWENERMMNRMMNKAADTPFGSALQIWPIADFADLADRPRSTDPIIGLPIYGTLKVSSIILM